MEKKITMTAGELESLIAMKLDEALKNSLGIIDQPKPVSVEAIESDDDQDEKQAEEKKSESVADIRASICA